MNSSRKAVVRHAARGTENFKVELGMHQGPSLSPFLFARVIDRWDQTAVYVDNEMCRWHCWSAVRESKEVEVCNGGGDEERKSVISRKSVCVWIKRGSFTYLGSADQRRVEESTSRVTSWRSGETSCRFSLTLSRKQNYTSPKCPTKERSRCSIWADFFPPPHFSANIFLNCGLGFLFFFKQDIQN